MVATSPDRCPPGVDLTRASVARVYDWFLGGGHHWAIDREFGRRAQAILPTVKTVARLNRGFVTRAVRYAAEHGVRQYLDLGAGIPSIGTVHEIAHTVDPTARVVYADHDAVAVSHGQLAPAGATPVATIYADLRDPASVLDHPVTRRLLDFSEPIMVIMTAVLHFVGPDDRPDDLVGRYRDVLCPGSYLALSHMTTDGADPEIAERAEQLRAGYRDTANPLFLRDRTEFSSWFTGLTLVEPGVVHTAEWRPEHPAVRVAAPAQSLGLCGLGRT